MLSLVPGFCFLVQHCLWASMLLCVRPSWACSAPAEGQDWGLCLLARSTWAIGWNHGRTWDSSQLGKYAVRDRAELCAATFCWKPGTSWGLQAWLHSACHRWGWPQPWFATVASDQWRMGLLTDAVSCWELVALWEILGRGSCGRQQVQCGQSAGLTWSCPTGRAGGFGERRSEEAARVGTDGTANSRCGG